MQEKSLKVDFFKLIGFVLLGIIILLIISFTFLPKYTTIRELTEENEALSERIDEIKIEIDTFKDDLEHLKEDPFYLEKVAREQLGAVKDNEVVIKIEE
ncbi:septum formation initiator family protein [Candidatus Omnitrophota bacterium]